MNKLDFLKEELKLNEEQSLLLNNYYDFLFNPYYILCDNKLNILIEFDDIEALQKFLKTKTTNSYKEGRVYDYTKIIVRSDFYLLKGKQLLDIQGLWKDYEENCIINNKGVIIDVESLKFLGDKIAVVKCTSGRKAYSKPYVTVDKILIHRIIMDAPKGKVVDHFNGNTLDNRRCNLRICTPQQNIINRIPQEVKNKTGYRGVNVYKNRYRMEIQVCNQRFIKSSYNKEKLGRLYDVIGLCLAYDFYNTNFPKENYDKKLLEKFKNLYLKSAICA